MRSVCAAVAILASCSVQSFAQSPGQPSGQTSNTDAADTIKKLLAPLSPVPWTHTVQKFASCHEVGPGDRPILVPCWQNVTQTDNVNLTASNIRIVSRQGLQFDPPIAIDVPDQLITSTAAYANCSATQTFSDSETLTVNFQRTSSVAISQSVTNAQSEAFNFSVKVEDVTLGGNVQVSNSSTSGTVDTNSFTQAVTRQKTISNPQVKPHTAFGLILETWPVNYVIKFHTVATVDADLNPNNKYHLLSDAITADKRTFPISGTITFVDAAAGVGYGYDLKYDFSKCPTGSIGIVPIPLDQVSKQVNQSMAVTPIP